MRSPKSPAANPRGRRFDRHVSGTGTRGLPKKGGAGGKGVWGAAMDQDGVAYLDKNDPNYDSDQETQNPPALDLSDKTAQEGAAPAADAGAADAAPLAPPDDSAKQQDAAASDQAAGNAQQ